MKRKSSGRKSFYDVLEINQWASPEVIEAAYKALMKKHHPDISDTTHGSHARELNEANDTLSDPDKRAKYDRQLRDREGAVVGEYEVLDRIAEGGFGKTYKARHNLTGELVCLKDCSNLDPKFQEILIEEAKAMWDLRHYSIPAVRGLIKNEDGGLILVMSYIPGLTIEQTVEKHGKLDPEAVAWMLERCLNALKYTHWHGVIHGDVKPQNIIQQEDTHQVTLVDFGLALVKPNSSSRAKGYTECFAPPEALAGKPLVPQSDLYGLGTTALYALSGGKIDNVIGRRVPDNIPRPLRKFIDRLIVHDVNGRPKWKQRPDDDGEDLCETIAEVRQESFGKRHSGMKPIKSA